MIIPLPLSVRIGCCDYAVSVMPAPLNDYNRDAVGRINFEQGELLLDDTLSRDALNKTFWHEVAHGIDNAYFGSELLTEAQTEVMATALAQVMRDLGFIFEKES
jgi:hypothetical protein